eukprot:197232-Rhodomonas_salina.1
MFWPSTFNVDLCAWVDRTAGALKSFMFQNNPKLSLCDVDECLAGVDDCAVSPRFALLPVRSLSILLAPLRYIDLLPASFLPAART